MRAGTRVGVLTIGAGAGIGAGSPGYRVRWGFFPKVVGFFPIRILVHSCASVCIFVHLIVFLKDVLHSTNRLHSNAFSNHFELLHSSEVSLLHFDAFYNLLHS